MAGAEGAHEGAAGGAFERKELFCVLIVVAGT